jgi:hypothetical protein
LDAHLSDDKSIASKAFEIHSEQSILYQQVYFGTDYRIIVKVFNGRTTSIILIFL